MGHLGTISRHRPEYAAFLNQRNIVHRGEVVVFRPNCRTPYFTTDAGGFRHTVLDGKAFSVGDALKRDRYGIVLGSSHVFGVGLVGNEHTIPSILSQTFGFPFANASLPEGNSRNLFSLLNAFVARSPKRPAVVVHFSGGDFSNLCIGGSADPVFGSPNLKQVGNANKRAPSYPPAKQFIPALLAFTTLWTRSIVQLCRASDIPIVLGNDTSFFEKEGEPSEYERTCRLGSAFNALQRHWFATHRDFYPRFVARREEIATNLSVRLAGPGARNRLTFIDEFHYDIDGTRAFANDLASAIEPLV